MNRITFIALANEYSQILQAVAEGNLDESRRDFVGRMVRLLPRLYIAATDLNADGSDGDHSSACTELDDRDDELLIDSWAIESLLDEDYYDAVRRSVESLMGEDDTYLEVFEEDMKYSDTPISASISEGLADLFQVLYNYIGTIQEARELTVASATAALRDDFAHYWSATLCNVLRALNHLYYNDNDY